MDRIVSVEGHGPMSSLSVASRSLRLIALAALAAVATACGGGGGGGDGGGGNPPPPTETGSLMVTVVDEDDVPVEDASISATVGSADVNGTTGADGVATLTGVAVGTATVEVSRTTFVPQTLSAPINANQTSNLDVVLVRATSAAGGSLTSRSGNGPVVTNNEQSMTFEVELVIVRSDSEAITTLVAEDFVLQECIPDPNTSRTDCIGGVSLAQDTRYRSTDPLAQAQAADLIVGGQPQPYAAGLMLDQSQTMNGSDPTDARLFSAKAFLRGLGGGDHVLLAAFARDGDDTDAVIPEEPVTFYPPFRDVGTTDDAPSYFDTLDSLSDLVGGGTPLYDGVDLVREAVVTDTTIPVGIAKAVVVFTDGADTECRPQTVPCPTRRNQVIEDAVADEVRVFTIGLSDRVDFLTLGRLAHETGGAFLFAESAEQLIPLYGSVGELLSLSLPTYRLRFNVGAIINDAGDPAPDTFLPGVGRSLLGRVTVTTPDGSFDVPFIVGIP